MQLSSGLLTLAGCALLLGPIASPSDDIPAFPGAEGYGAGTPGGRGGEVILVSNLNDSGPGSLRAACEAKGPRIVVFRVAGIIDLETPIRVTEPNLTIAAQTAPGEGICLRRRGIHIDTHDVVIRYLRSRPGDIAGGEPDALSIGGSSRNVIIDHCSTTWASDENLSPSGGISNITIQWCLIAEGLNRNLHHKGAHGYGSLCRATGGVSLHHNLWAHNQHRNPRIGDNYGRPPYPTYDIRNNVMYNFGGLSIVGDRLSANYVANYWKGGPSTDWSNSYLGPADKAQLRFHVEGNVAVDRPEVTKDPRSLFSRMETDGRQLVELVGEPFPAPAISHTTAENAYLDVLAGAGATLPVRDAVDSRIAADVHEGTGAIIDSQWEVDGWPQYQTARPPLDSDRDGMPDRWEHSHGLNPKAATDSRADRDGDGYTSIEEYFHSLEE